jgi:molybdopterin-containing oxidoreductase family iron-sulfur binding subunit
VAVISDLQSGSLAVLIRHWLALFNSNRYLVYEPLNYETLREANRLLFGQSCVPVYPLDNVDFLLSFGADFLETWVSPVLYTREFARAREPRDGRRTPFVYVGPRVSMTAANADERLLLSPGHEHQVALALFNVMRTEGLLPAAPYVPVDVASYTPESVARGVGLPANAIRRLARRFAAARAPLALAGAPLHTYRSDPPGIAAQLLSAAVASPMLDFGTLHALGDTATAAETGEFVKRLGAGEIDVLLVIGANPLFALREFGAALRSVKHVVALTPYLDETAKAANWVLPTHTPLESWGDYEPQTGVTNLMQPTMGALYDTQMAGDVLIALAKAAGIDPVAKLGAESFHGFIRSRWQQKHRASGGDESFESLWQAALQRGGVWTEPPPRRPTLVASPDAIFFAKPQHTPPVRLHTYPSISLFDGRGANKRWLQELPDPITKVAWGSWIEVSPPDAKGLGIERGRLVKVEGEGGSVTAPALIYEGLAPGTIAAPLGQGHTAYGRSAKGLGANALQLLGGSGEVRLTVLRGRGLLPCPDGSTSQEGRGMIRTVGLAHLGREKRDEIILPLPAGYTLERDMTPPHPYAKRRWAMAVDLSRCVGCGACVTACYAENNLGVVGRKRFAQHRDMSWLRIDRYYDWSDLRAPVLFQPMLCQHCDAAPCETVCPVFAAAHNEEGLNMQVYNRCVGTRYCSNNCPYKVRRFNWSDYDWPEPLNWQANPEVSVRRRGVMEKCSFCIQRIREVEARAKREGRPVRDGEVVPACVQTCPAGVFTFGDLLDPHSRIAEIVRDEPRLYQVFEHLNTKPGVFYLKRVVAERA